MTVRELLLHLQKFEPEREVCYAGGGPFAHRVNKIFDMEAAQHDGDWPGVLRPPTASDVADGKVIQVVLLA